MRISNIWGAFFGLFMTLGLWYGFKDFFTEFIATMFTGTEATIAYIAFAVLIFMTLFGMITQIAQRDDSNE